MFLLFRLFRLFIKLLPILLIGLVIYGWTQTRTFERKEIYGALRSGSPELVIGSVRRAASRVLDTATGVVRKSSEDFARDAVKKAREGAHEVLDEAIDGAVERTLKDVDIDTEGAAAEPNLSP